jgi:FdhD protein
MRPVFDGDVTQATDGADAALPPVTQPLQVVRLTAAQPCEGAFTTDPVAVETPVALVFNGITHVVMMATPADLEDLALGFALSEGLLAERGECFGIEVRSHALGLEVLLDVSGRAVHRLTQRRRTLSGRTGCGLCGIDSLQQLDLQPDALAVPPWAARLSPDVVLRALAQLPGRQPINALTGACHAAGWATPEGELITVMEDVGRHNALDKLLGQRARLRATDAGFVVVSSRASFELVRKCARMNVPVLAAISAPTTLAVDIARQAGLQLYGFCRDAQVVRYGAA